MTDTANFPTAEQIDSSDLVIQYGLDFGFPEAKVYYSYRGLFESTPPRWTYFDPEDGAEGDRPYETEDFTILLNRDRLTGMAAVTFPSELGKLTVEELDALKRPTVIIADTDREADRVILQKIHSEWWNLEVGVDEQWKAVDLVRCYKHLTLVWQIPADATEYER